MSHALEIIFCSYATIFPFISVTAQAAGNRICLTGEQIEKILHGCTINCRAAQKELYANYYGYTMSIALRYSSSYDSAVEMINDAFLKIFREVKNFEPRYGNTVASFTAWVKQIMIYSCIDHIRKYNKKEIMTSIDSEQVMLADECETAEEMLQRKEIIKCIQKLSPGYKAVFNLFVIEGFSHAEIAKKLDISEGASKSNLHKAKQNLQHLLEKSNLINYSIAS
jgi:RNA polymerase sigma-70 factor (ECF subfamily)